MFFCIPIMMGCQAKIKPEQGISPRVCPRCNNVSVAAAKKTTWFELFWIPLVPFNFKHIWICSICQWNHPKADGQWEPSEAAGGRSTAPISHGTVPNAPGYQPSYISQPGKH